MTSKPTALEICRQNTVLITEAELLRRRADRDALRAHMPEACAFAAELCAELAADRTGHPRHPPFKPRVMRMTEGEKIWIRPDPPM